MSKQLFNLRLAAAYAQPDNTIDKLDVDVLVDGEWTALDLDTRTPGFLIYVYSMFTCQHTFLRTNSTERNLELNDAQGFILVEASEDWLLEKIDVQFDATVSGSLPSEEDVDYIVSRMKNCPVSRNLPENIISHTRVDFKNIDKARKSSHCGLGPFSRKGFDIEDGRFAFSCTPADL